MIEMTQTEKLLQQAAEIAKNVFVDPTEAAVMRVFERLTYELDNALNEREETRALTH